MATNDTKMGWNCDSDKRKHKYNSKILTATWLPPQRAERQVLKIRPRTYVTLLRGLYKTENPKWRGPVRVKFRHVKWPWNRNISLEKNGNKQNGTAKLSILQGKKKQQQQQQQQKTATTFSFLPFYGQQMFRGDVFNSYIRGTQREYSSKPLKHRIVKRTLVFKQ